MKSNSKEVRAKIKQHILDSVTDVNGNNYTDLKEACNRLNNEFDRVANHPHNLNRFPNNQERFADYLNGIPFGFEYDNYSIEQYLNSLGLNPDDKKYSSNKMYKMYTYLIFSEMNKNQ